MKVAKFITIGVMNASFHMIVHYCYSNIVICDTVSFLCSFKIVRMRHCFIFGAEDTIRRSNGFNTQSSLRFELNQQIQYNYMRPKVTKPNTQVKTSPIPWLYQPYRVHNLSQMLYQWPDICSLSVNLPNGTSPRVSELPSLLVIHSIEYTAAANTHQVEMRTGNTLKWLHDKHLSPKQWFSILRQQQATAYC